MQYKLTEDYGWDKNNMLIVCVILSLVTAILVPIIVVIGKSGVMRDKLMQDIYDALSEIK